jgi:hypothetical protein
MKIHEDILSWMDRVGMKQISLIFNGENGNECFKLSWEWYPHADQIQSHFLEEAKEIIKNTLIEHFVSKVGTGWSDESGAFGVVRAERTEDLKKLKFHTVLHERIVQIKTRNITSIFV